MCNEYHQIANLLNCKAKRKAKNHLKSRNVTHFSNTRTSKNIRYYDPVYPNRPDYPDPNTYVYPNNCSSNTALFTAIANSLLVNESSFSPWEYVINIDENRFDANISTVESNICNSISVTKKFCKKN